MNNIIYSLFNSYSKVNMIKILDFLIDDINNICAEWHPLGFIYIKLIQGKKNDYRLHIWPKETRSSNKTKHPIHNHIYNIESLVVSGKVGCEAYSIEKKTISKTKLYKVHYSKSGSKLVSTNESVNIEKKNISWTNTGNTYIIEKGDYHQSVVEQNTFAATVVKNYNKSDNIKPTVIVNEVDFYKHNCPTEKIDKDFVLVKLKELRNRVNNNL
ncbi:hypothetical protein [Flavivirga jejuensis]|uniref:Uncharacterized protein n=1 Tax=Flavivirga jejuensis TaxID=870487 RepID=A0ABT8WTC6_9FLAO|nr:hypothetical protein [Flavivirga jejuensis]MDO5976224.1 hypothetical protein [Flavivirga jejuensis]